MRAEWEEELRENDYEEDEEVQEAVRKMEDADGPAQSFAKHDEMRQEVRRLNQTVRGRRLGKAVAASPYLAVVTQPDNERSDDE